VLVGAAWTGRNRDVDAGTLRKHQARAARKRLAGAEKLVSGQAETFYAEVERALLSFLESKLGEPVQGLTRGPLEHKLRSAGATDAQVSAVLTVLDACEMGRFAPGALSASRDTLLDQAESAMEGWS
jgi:hypothetical protein